ncbi:hypothetical protein [Staphylococcus chromogenes]|uniref:hypothetical protein n=1 Tax=Staphylococcus chromogenes TaxID=46126 RepID=UPI002885FBEB|nr:hypothetical protein [Staphylococcus chromogenes]MDT0679676.1 hypothetical protein [Staphylococcus chromogenes]
MYTDPLKNVRGILYEQISSLQRTVDIAMKPSREALCSIKRSGVYNQLQLSKSMNNDMNRTLMNLKLETANNALLFNKNLFSNKVLNDFIESTTISKDEVLKMSNALRDLNFNITIPSFSESINSSHPIDEPQNNGNSKEFTKILNNHVITPSNKLANLSSKAIFVETSADFVLRLIHHDPVNTSVYIWVLFFSYLGFCLTSKKDD